MFQSQGLYYPCVLDRTTLISGLVDSWGARLSRVEMFCIARLDETAGRGYSRWMFTPENGGPLVSEMELRAEDDPDIRMYVFCLFSRQYVVFRRILNI